MKMYELHPTMEYPAGQELSPSRRVVEKIVEVLGKSKEDSWDRNSMEQLVAKELGIGRASAKFGISCAILDGFIQNTSGVCEAEDEVMLAEDSCGHVAEIVQDLSEVVVKDNLERLAEAEAENE